MKGDEAGCYRWAAVDGDPAVEGDGNGRPSAGDICSRRKKYGLGLADGVR